MSILELVLSAESSQVADGTDRIPLGVDEARVHLDVVTFSDAVFVRPTFVRLQFTRASCQLSHRSRVQQIASAKVCQVDDRDGVAGGVPESDPCQDEPAAGTGCVWVYVEPEGAVGAARTFNPGSLALKKVRYFGEFQDCECEVFSAVAIPGLLHVAIHMNSVA